MSDLFGPTIEPIDPTVGRDNGKFLGELARDGFTRAEARRRYKTAWPQACPALIDANLRWRNR